MSSLSAIFSSDLLVKLLTLFLLNPEQEFYQTELNERTGGTLRNTQKMLLKLEAVSLISRFKRGKMTYYRSNRKHPAFDDLKRLFIKTVALGETLKEALKGLEERIELAFIFGSYARGEESADSDIDLFILGDLSLKELSAVTGDFLEQIGREVNPVVYHLAEFQKRHREHNRFILELLSCPKIWLTGSQHELETMVE